MFLFCLFIAGVSLGLAYGIVNKSGMAGLFVACGVMGSLLALSYMIHPLA